MMRDAQQAAGAYGCTELKHLNVMGMTRTVYSTINTHTSYRHNANNDGTHDHTYSAHKHKEALDSKRKNSSNGKGNSKVDTATTCHDIPAWNTRREATHAYSTHRARSEDKSIAAKARLQDPLAAIARGCTQLVSLAMDLHLSDTGTVCQIDDGVYACGLSDAYAHARARVSSYLLLSHLKHLKDLVCDFYSPWSDLHALLRARLLTHNNTGAVSTGPVCGYTVSSAQAHSKTKDPTAPKTPSVVACTDSCAPARNCGGSANTTRYSSDSNRTNINGSTINTNMDNEGADLIQVVRNGIEACVEAVEERLSACNIRILTEDYNEDTPEAWLKEE